MMLHCVPGVMSSRHTDIMSADYPPVNFISHILFQTSWILQTVYILSAENQIPPLPLWSLPLILTPYPSCNPEGGGGKGVPSPLLSGGLMAFELCTRRT